MEKRFSGKRLLILGGAFQCLKVVELAKEMGAYTIIADRSAHVQTAEAADEYIQFSVMDHEGLYDWCRENPVDGVLNYCIDYSQHTHQILCDRFGFPCFGNEEIYHILTDKSAFKKVCVENGIDVISEYDPDNIPASAYPVVVKPAEASGSRGLSICHSEDELEESLEKAAEFTRNGKIIIEQYMGGKQDFTVTYLVVEGEPYLVRAGDRYLGKIEDGLNRQCICTVSPSENLELFMKKGHGKIVNMLKNLGMQNGPAFFQGFIDGDTIRFYDPAIRFPGGEYDRLLLEATGIDLVKALIIYALTGTLSVDGDIENAFLLNGKVGVQLTIAAGEGTISEYSGFEKIEKIPGVICAAKKARVGRTIARTGDLRQRIAEVDYLADDHALAQETASRIYDYLTVLDENGKDMLVSKYV